MGIPLRPCSAVGHRAQSERVPSTLDPSAGPAATIKCWHAHGVHARQGFVRGERRGTVARRASRRLECAPRVRSRAQLDSGSTPARLRLARTRLANCSAAFFSCPQVTEERNAAARPRDPTASYSSSFRGVNTSGREFIWGRKQPTRVCGSNTNSISRTRVFSEFAGGAPTDSPERPVRCYVSPTALATATVR